MSNENVNSTFVLNPTELLSKLQTINDTIMDCGEFRNLTAGTEASDVTLDTENGRKQTVEFYDIYYPTLDEPLTRIAFMVTKLDGKDTSGFIVDSPLNGYSFHTITGDSENDVANCLTGLYAEILMVLLYKLVDSRVFTDNNK